LSRNCTRKVAAKGCEKLLLFFTGPASLGRLEEPRVRFVRWKDVRAAHDFAVNHGIVAVEMCAAPSPAPLCVVARVRFGFAVATDESRARVGFEIHVRRIREAHAQRKKLRRPIGVCCSEGLQLGVRLSAQVTTMEKRGRRLPFSILFISHTGFTVLVEEHAVVIFIALPTPTALWLRCLEIL
jgi:hypothetical protein